MPIPARNSGPPASSAVWFASSLFLPQPKKNIAGGDVITMRRPYVGITHLRYRRSAAFPGHPLSLASQVPAQTQYSLYEQNTDDKKKQGRNRAPLRYRPAM